MSRTMMSTTTMSTITQRSFSESPASRSALGALRRRAFGLVGGVALALGLVGALAFGPLSTAPALAQGATPAGPAAPGAQFKVGDQVTITLKDGKTTTGEIVEITKEGYRVRVKRGIGTAVEAFTRDVIVSITKSGGEDAPKPTESGRPTLGPAGGASGGVSGSSARAGASTTGDATKDDGKPVVYVIPLTGRMRFDISSTPMRRVVEDAKKIQPDVIVLSVNMDFIVPRGDKVQDQAASAIESDSLANQDLVREIEALFTEQIRDDESWKKKPRFVVWVQRALGSPAMLVFPFREIYFHSSGRLGGVGHLERSNEGEGDIEVLSKWRGIALGRTIGLANKGGHDRRLIEAMMRGDYKLSYSMVGGQPKFFENTTEGDFVLTNGGEPPDTMQEIIDLTGKNTLTLSADLALKLGMSKGSADTLAQVLDLAGLPREYRLVDDSAAKILRGWRTAVGKAQADAIKLWREFQELPMGGPTPSARNQQRSRAIGMLNRISSLLAQYGESFSPRGMPASPVAWDSNIKLTIDRLQKQMRDDR
jgi:hypothetical protein